VEAGQHDRQGTGLGYGWSSGPLSHGAQGHLRLLDDGHSGRVPTRLTADPIKAWAFATLAAERGEKDASKLAADIAEKFDAKQREEANKELQNIKSNKPAPAKVPEPKPAVAPKK
jgi:hypothetical protein